MRLGISVTTAMSFIFPAAERSVSLLRQELECVHESVLEQQTLVVQREEEIAALHQLLERTQGKCQEKLTVCDGMHTVICYFMT